MGTSRPAIPDENLEAARRLYAALCAQDARALLDAITPGFRGVVADGMPNELGGTYDGAETMLRECWARVFAVLDLRPAPAVKGDDSLSANHEPMLGTAWMPLVAQALSGLDLDRLDLEILGLGEDGVGTPS